MSRDTVVGPVEWPGLGVLVMFDARTRACDASCDP